MLLPDLIAKLNAMHIYALPPWERVRVEGWYVVIGYSAYDPNGFSITVNPPHYAINTMVARALEQLGLEVEWQTNFGAMEAHQPSKIISATQCDP
ncbi:hypothetical protein RQP53_03455 [Paucibacter sp. APW11]|uniref:Uncharacterized protein n=1 Tax=Roseateles aquae TaxID=3077235 RepID=A0ABU3P6X5_9BURK|nr:hypothetical protein [Paucibacter sp. APW11]MDT8998329.1 hypothetical protein [Paucibacter sp. APW11]